MYMISRNSLNLQIFKFFTLIHLWLRFILTNLLTVSHEVKHSSHLPTTWLNKDTWVKHALPPYPPRWGVPLIRRPVSCFGICICEWEQSSVTICLQQWCKKGFKVCYLISHFHAFPGPALACSSLCARHWTVHLRYKCRWNLAPAFPQVVSIWVLYFWENIP